MAVTDEKLRCDQDAVRIVWNSGAATTLPYLWLRDNCGCDDCRIQQTDEKKFIVSSVAADIVLASAELSGDQLRVVWPDGHCSTFEGERLRAFGNDTEIAWSPWPPGFSPQRCAYRSFLGDDGVAADAIERFITDGAMILEKAPVEAGTLEFLAPRLGPVREVLFDRIHDVAVDPSGYNVAHTPLPLPPHNDFASYTWPPSVQALHMLVNETPGGESIIVDGWAVLETLRAEHPDYFDMLGQVPVPFREFDADTETYAVEPIVRCDTEGRIAGLRFSNQLMQAINPNDSRAADFYRAYRELCCRLTDPDSQVSFRLNAGEILVIAAHRVLHGRRAFEPTGHRHLQDAYFEFDNVRNQLVVLQRKGVRNND
ncbi:MAG: TauD/TfdA family dioxygenase [Gammaproteobacteria bacterium]|nr:TauD/TfdA family dioxygenase [Gammaproteobacteria bacterium]